jgi:hypothetical protein
MRNESDRLTEEEARFELSQMQGAKRLEGIDTDEKARRSVWNSQKERAKVLNGQRVFGDKILGKNKVTSADILRQDIADHEERERLKQARRDIEAA